MSGPIFRFLDLEGAAGSNIFNFSFDRAVFYLNGKAVFNIRTDVKMYMTHEFDIVHKPGFDSDKYLPWCESIYQARGQIGLKTEEMSIRSNVSWTAGAQVTVSTKTIVYMV